MMLRASGLICVALLGAVLVHASNVLDLTKTTAFDAVVGKEVGALVEYFAPWCGHCKNLAPEYEKVADSFASKSNKVVIGKVDADSNRELGSRAGVKGFPTILFYPAQSTDPVEYRGARTAEAIADFVTQQSKVRSKMAPSEPSAVVEVTADDFDAIVMDPKKDVLVEFYAPWCGYCKKLAPIYESMAQVFRRDSNCVVAKIDMDNEDNAAVRKRFQIKSFPTLLFFPAGSDDKWPRPYIKERTEEDFIAFMNEKCFTFRNKDGTLGSLAGRLPSLDGLASRFYHAAADARDTLVQDAKRFAGELTEKEMSPAKDEAARYYLRVMERASRDGLEYVKRESERISKIIAKHTAGTTQLAGEKLDQLQRKANVLSAFLNKRIADSIDRAVKSAEAEKAQQTAAETHEEL
ncbi:protein disulfide-isomerase [Malassezia vespertilionis]|uniref:protein disulfide-isomerase n=1 Tax=Malassezia vespertilionis TaxID=2020962 RepID=A0A2N1J717_9BASI|nr:protein disulfide-isomerase [Malassezia vespertilionis]PKI82346.1 hypothetical protein MVES_003734 [Malassezia vespertilionis]WFD08127.1 protein disulfide-isomerase [Malassezia vespertilionis]